MSGLHDVELYDGALAPPPFGLANTGAICYFNSLLQALASCPSFLRACADRAGELAGSALGRALTAFARDVAASAARAAPGAPPPDPGAVARHSAAVLAALRTEHANRKDAATPLFGRGQESASEALVLLLDLAVPAAPAGAPAPPNPLTRLFEHRSRAHVVEPGGARRAAAADASVHFDLFVLDAMPPASRPRDPAAFARLLHGHSVDLEGYAGATARYYELATVAEVLVIVFNRYGVAGRGVSVPRAAHYFPPELRFPLRDGENFLRYRLVAQVEHAGNLSGGHYWGRFLRRAGAPAVAPTTADGLSVWTADDTRVSPAVFGPSPGTYLLFYHAS